jgi:hypothetical protein
LFLPLLCQQQQVFIWTETEATTMSQKFCKKFQSFFPKSFFSKAIFSISNGHVRQGYVGKAAFKEVKKG